MENINTSQNLTEEETKEMMKEFLHSFISMCPQCAHEKVCKLTEPVGTLCKEFLNSGDYKRYGNINDLFQPIFDWLEYHYPHGEMKFIVDNKSAVMHLVHGVSAYSKKVTEFSFVKNKQAENAETEKPDN